MTSAFFAQLTPAWLSARLDGRAVAGIAFDDADIEKLNQTSGIRFARVTFEDGGALSLVFKIAPSSPLSELLGLAREGYFYERWATLPTAAGAACELGGVLPRVLHAEGRMETGEKVVVMEDLTAESVQLGCAFPAAGAWPGNPNNWGRALRAPPRAVDAAEATRLAFAAAATLHAPFWGCAALTEHAWLRGAGWLRGEERASWEEAQAHTAAQWALVKARIAGGGGGGGGAYAVRWHPHLVACIDAALAKVSWDAYQAELRARPFTLVHGDFHPANLLLSNDGERVKIVDWEVVGVGSGPQDLGQFMISHVEPTARASIERAAVAAYHAALMAANARIAVTPEKCWEEYVNGGLGRWLFFLPYDGWGAPPSTSQFFADQVLAFIQAHGITPENVPMPRM
jgi:hypothetical protein